MCSTPSSHGTHTATANICGDTAEECLMRAQCGPAMERGLRQMGYHYPFLLITGSVCCDWLPSRRLLGRAAAPALLGGRSGPSFSSTRISSWLPWRPQTFLAQCGPWGTGPGAEKRVCSCHLPKETGRVLGAGQVQSVSRYQARAWAAGTPAQAEAARKPLLRPAGRSWPPGVSVRLLPAPDLGLGRGP